MTTTPVGKGHYKHGEFDLMEGCPQCIEEGRAEEKAREAEELPGVAPEPLSEEARRIITGGRDEMIAAATSPSKPIASFDEKGFTLNFSPSALAKSPGADVEVMSYHAEALKLQEFAESLVIIGPETAKEATDNLSFISKLKKAMEVKKREYLDPLRTKAEAIRETYATLMDPVFAADRVTREKLGAYQQEQEAKRERQEEVNRLRMEAAQKEAAISGTGEITESVNLVEVAPEVKSVRTNLGIAGMVDCWKYEVTDFARLPEEYKVADTAMLNSIAKKHHDQKLVPGVRFYNEPTIAVRAR